MLPKKNSNKKFEKLVVGRREERFVNRKKTTEIIFYCESFDEEIYYVEHWFIMEKEVPDTDIFDGE